MTIREHHGRTCRVPAGRPGGGRLWRAALAVLCAVAVVGAASGGVGAQEGVDGEEAVVRIVAQRHGDSRIEFALQQQGAAGDWGSRLLPTKRFFPPDATVERWLVSTPLALAEEPLVVRITARRVAAGRVEFALQQQEGDGAWGERLLPAKRFFPRASAVGRWLVSTPLVVHGPNGSSEEPRPPEDRPSGTSDDPREEFASLVLERANDLRGGSAPLALDGGLSVAALAKAQAQADSGDWQEDFDYGPLLLPEWGVWLTVMSARITNDIDDPGVAQAWSESLLFGGAAPELLKCDLCMHLGVGVAAAGGWTHATAVVAGPPPPPEVIAAAEVEMAELVNDLRQSLGLDALTYHSGVAAVARDWSQTMAGEGIFEHNPNVTAEFPPGWTSIGENIALAYLSASLRGAVQWSFDGLVDSPSHYATMTVPKFTHLGVGIAVEGGKVLVTQNFARYPS